MYSPRLPDCLAAAHGFDALITGDRSVEYQRNLNTLPIPAVAILARDTGALALKPLVSQVVDLVSGSLDLRV